MHKAFGFRAPDFERFGILKNCILPFYLLSSIYILPLSGGLFLLLSDVFVFPAAEITCSVFLQRFYAAFIQIDNSMRMISMRSLLTFGNSGINERTAAMKNINVHEAPKTPASLKQRSVFFRFCAAYPDYDRETKSAAHSDRRSLRAGLKRSWMRRRKGMIPANFI
jgi:hypothetical protein